MMNMGTSAAQELLVADFAKQRRAAISPRLLDGMTERHGCDLMAETEFESDAALDRTIEGHGGGVVFVMDRGLAPSRIIRHSARLLRHSRPVYYFWPDEQAIEVVDDIRLSSYRRHHLAAVAWYAKPRVVAAARNVARCVVALPRRFVRRRRQQDLSIIHRQVATEREQIRTNGISEEMEKVHRDRQDVLARGTARSTGVLDPAKLPSRENPIPGHGLYVRLDYWAKIATGGSYGHTCFLANALGRVTETLDCVMANRFELLDELGVRQRVISGAYSSSSSGIILNAPRFTAPLTAVFDEIEPVYVYERSVLGNREAARLCAARGVPYILEYNGSELSMARSFGRPYEHEALLEEIEAYAFDAATAINVISEPVAQSLYERGVSKDKILINPNAVDPEFYRPLAQSERSATRRELGVADDDIVVGFCGTFGGWHGIEVLAAGLPRICALGPHVKFLLIGDGNLKHLVKKAIADHGLEKQVVDVGLVPQLRGARYLGAADILVATHAQNIDGKTFFGSPTKLFECMATGAAIVCSDLAQLGEVMRPALLPADFAGGTPDAGNARGLLVTPGSTDEYVEAVARLVADAGLRETLGRNAREAAIKNYTWDIHVENIWRHMAGLPLVGYADDRHASAGRSISG